MENVGPVTLEAENLDPRASKALDSLGLGLSHGKGAGVVLYNWGQQPLPK